MTKEEMDLIRDYVENIQTFKVIHLNDGFPINYGTLCTITAKGYELLKKLKELEQEPCEDCISRARALSDYADWYGYGYRDNTFYKILKDMPSVTPKTECSCEQIKWERDMAIAQLKELGYGLGEKPKTAHWILLDECSNSGYYCSECHKKVVKEGWSDTVKKIKFCPNCGRGIVELKKSEE